MQGFFYNISKLESVECKKDNTVFTASTATFNLIEIE